MESKLILLTGESLRLDKSRTKGTMGQTDISNYSIVNALGEVTGSVEHIDHTAINGFGRTQSVVQKNAQGVVVVDEQW